MRYSDYIASGLKRWPETVDISDGRLIEDDGGHFPTLSTIWNAIEAQETSETEVHGLLAWAIFSGFHRAAGLALKQGVSSVRKDALDLDYIHDTFNESFYSEDGDWGEYHSSWDDDYRKTDAE